MKCIACSKLNLPGGVRCSYCGTLFPPTPDFDFEMAGVSAPAAGQETLVSAPSPSPAASPSGGSGAGSRGARTSLLGALALLVVKGKTLLGLFKFGKIALTLGSMFGFIWSMALLYKWSLAAGFGVCILIHELGHVFVNWRKGLKQSAPMFIPFVGAVIFIKQFPNNPTIEAECGAGGPAGGLLASVVCMGIGLLTGNPFWLALAQISFTLNLFNLAPFWQLDGAHIAAAFSPGNWNFVLGVLLLWVIKAPVPWLWILLVLGFLSRIGNRPDERYYLAEPLARARMVVVYLVLCFALSYGAQFTSSARSYLNAALTTSPLGGARASVPHSALIPALLRASHSAKQHVSPGSARRRSGHLMTPLDPRTDRSVRMVVLGGTWALGSGGWLLVCTLLCLAAGQKMSWRRATMAAWMSGGLAAGFLLKTIVSYDSLDLLGAYFAALVTGLFFGVYQMVQVGDRRIRMPLRWLTLRCLGWAAGAGILIAYWQDDARVLLVITVAAILFYVRRPWLFFSLAGRLYEQIGDLDRGIALRRRAIDAHPDPEGAAELWNEIARLEGSMARGERALQALDALAAGDPPPQGSPASLFNDYRRADALMEMDRFEDALRQCEQLLQSPEGDRVALWRPILVHAILGQLAVRRGWDDEAIAQADCILHARVPKSALTLIRSLVATAHRIRSQAHLLAGRLDEAIADAEKSLELGRTPIAEAQVAVVRAEVCLCRGDTAGADRESDLAMRRFPGSLRVRYCRGRALIAAGREAEGRALLQDLATRFPNDHFGKEVLSAYSRV